MVTIAIDTVQFHLKEYHDFTWLKSLGRVFSVFEENDSGNISFGVSRGTNRYFVKAAGLKTSHAVLPPENAIQCLKRAVKVYEDIRHPNLIELTEHRAVDDIYIAIFKWVDGECLYDHWNFAKYTGNPQLKSPAVRFRTLPVEKRLKSAEVLFSFLAAAAACGYTAIDFYDGSIIYDFKTDTTTICDIDLFRKNPVFNDMGENFWGSRRLKSPEEYKLHAPVDERTNVFTLGALLFHIFGSYSREELNEICRKSAFVPCARENWQLNEAAYRAAQKAVLSDRNERYSTIEEFHTAWNRALTDKGKDQSCITTV